jgi:protein-disulfide isomerase
MSLQIRKAERRAAASGMVSLFLGLLWVGTAMGGGGQGTASEQRAAARVDGHVITMQELEKALAAQLAKLQEQRYQLMQSKLDELIDGRLIEQEAKRRGTTVEALLKAEVSSKVSKATDLEVSAFINENRARLKNEGPEIRDKVRDYLDYQKEFQQRRMFVTGLRQRANLAIFLQEPEPIRVVVSIEGAFSKGPKDAPITIVEFSDFQCPFCRNSVATLKEVMRQYDGKIRWAFRDFPIPSLHPQASKAAEAARCAGEQGKFWEYHDLLFDSKVQWTPADFKKFAEQLKLEPKRFGSCLDSGKYQAAVQSDIEDGVRLGITGTPTFFVNGRVIVGAVPLENLKKIVEAELRGKSR